MTYKNKIKHIHWQLFSNKSKSYMFVLVAVDDEGLLGLDSNGIPGKDSSIFVVEEIRPRVARPGVGVSSVIGSFSLSSVFLGVGSVCTGAVDALLRVERGATGSTGDSDSEVLLNAGAGVLGALFCGDPGFERALKWHKININKYSR